jgi:hypothetical protein
VTNDELADILLGLIGEVDGDAADALVEAAARLQAIETDDEADAIRAYVDAPDGLRGSAKVRLRDLLGDGR